MDHDKKVISEHINIAFIYAVHDTIRLCWTFKVSGGWMWVTMSKTLKVPRGKSNYYIFNQNLNIYV